MLVFATIGHIFKTIKAKLDDAMKEDVHGRDVMDEFVLFPVPSTVKELIQRM